MPFRSGSLSVRRYAVTSDRPEALDKTATMAIRRHAWRPIDARRGERESFGWVNPRRLLADEFEWHDVTDGHLAFLAVRRDRKTFSRALFLARREEIFAQVKKEKGLTRLTRQHRLALEEELTIKMLAETTPTTAITELVWDMNTGEVFIGATGKSLCERIADLFASTFDLKLAPQFPALRGFRMLSEQGLEDDFVHATVAASNGGLR
jgi:hypothetical protein